MAELETLPKTCPKGHKQYAFDLDGACTKCADQERYDYAKQTEEKRVALLERDVVSREESGKEYAAHVLKVQEQWKIDAELMREQNSIFGRIANALEARAK